MANGFMFIGFETIHRSQLALTTWIEAAASLLRAICL
jgi:hypothetical protein